MQAIGKNIVIRAVDEEIKTESGLLLSGEDAKAFRYRKGIVAAPGSDVHVIKEGDEIYYDKGQSYTMMIGGEQFTIISERDVVVVINR